ncbi:amino acid adenylation domain-containing protein [Streptomyces sp. NPDC021093]|uniref:amino acid adenylation domain-containing protein n=1 Tax=Streptomyces sp. NPDC021093 TaxID=3365112 RepID=UPI0037ABDEC9
MSETTDTARAREDRIAALPEHLRELLRSRLAGDEEPAAAPQDDDDRIPRAPRDAPLPMSFAQQRMWFLQELDPASVGYNSSFGLRLTGDLDPQALRRALDGVVARHESLRTTFDSVDGRAVQIVHPGAEVPFTGVDLDGHDEEHRRAQLEKEIGAELARPFDLRVGPLVRVLLARLTAREHVLVLTMHHISHDGWSLSVFASDLGELYRAERAGRPADLAPVDLQYADFAVWQRDRLSGDAPRQSLRFWQDRLAGLSPLELPTDRPRPALRTSVGGVHSFEVPREVAAGLRTLAEKSRATLFMTLTAATQVLLGRYTGQTDIAVGTPVAGRDHPGLDKVIGLFLNTLVLRSQVEPDLTFGQFLHRTREVVLDAFGHQEVPFEQVVEAVQPERDASRMPLAQVLVVLQNQPESELDLAGVHFEQIRLPQASTGFDLVLGFEERPEGALHVDLEYSGDLFDESTVHRLAGHLVTLMGSLVRQPDLPLSRHALLTDAEHGRLTAQWPHEPSGVPTDAGVHDLVARQAALHPHAVAVECGTERTTYGELDGRANQLARHLQDFGVGRGSVVGVCLDRGTDLVVATLAVLRAGAAFMPLNAAFPAARRSLMLTETEAPVVLTQRSLAEDFSGGPAEVIAVDTRLPAVETRGTGPLQDGPSDPDALAYVIYTSGSTGQPKGVLVTHRGLVSMVGVCGRRFAVGVGSTVLQLSSPSFDGAVWETFVALANGAALALPEPGADAIGPELVTGLAAGRPVLLSLPPAALAALDPQALAPGSVVLAVGDRCPVDLARVWARSHRFVNGYGPTEATVGATFFEGEIPQDMRRLPIGRPIPGAEVYVLDAHLAPVPVGVTGEIYIGGPGVARGYLGRPELTGQRFVTHPFRADPAARLYRTGDLGAWLATGDIDFRGRADDQVKIRGFRVEPGEIETALLRLPGIAQAAVLVLENDRRKQLVGYLVPTVPDGIDTAEVREQLALALPAFMMPSAFVVLDRMPMTNHAKVDRRALAAVPVAAAAERVLPGTPEEHTLAEVFGSVLGAEEISVHDDFFDLGGDSILSTQIVSRARRAGLVLTVRDLFQHPTVAKLAKVVRTEEQRSAGAAETTPAGPVPLSPVQQWFFDTHTANPHHFNQSLLLELVTGTDPEVLRSALTALTEHHAALRLRFRHADGQWHQETVAEARGSVLLSRLDLSDVPDDRLEHRVDEAVLAAQRGLDIGAGPVARAVFMDLGAARAPRLFLTAHHLVVDGVSWRILLDDLRTAYTQLTAGRQADLGPRSTSFPHWVQRLKAHTDSGGFDDEVDYWKGVTEASAGTTADVRSDPAHAPDPGTVAEARTVRVSLDPVDTDVLLRQVPGLHRAHINDVFLAALGRALCTWTGRERVRVDLEGHGREEDILEDVDLTRTVGWFTTVYPLALTAPAAGEEAARTVRSVKRRLRALPRRGIGYGALHHLASSPRGGDPVLGSGPGTGQVPGPGALASFNYLGQWDSRFTGDDLIAAHLPHEGQEHEPTEQRVYLLDVVGGVQGGRLELSCTYPGQAYEEAEVTGFLEEMLGFLRELVRAAA